MGLSEGFLGTLTGNDPTGRGDEPTQAFKRAIADRFAVIRDTLVQRRGEYLYDGNRCRAENIGWRVIQSYGMRPIAEVAEGKHDDLIEGAWHENASSEHWYTYEKDWGYGPGMGAFGYDE